jgi:hypothetical protein
MAVESSFRNVTNGKSLGYVQMQMNTLKDTNKIYDIKRVTNVSQFRTSLDNQLYYTALHLSYLKGKVKSERGMFLAYNVGLGAYNKGKYNPKYYTKIATKRQLFNKAK